MPQRNWLGTTSDRLDLVRGIETYVQTRTEPLRTLISDSTGSLSSSVVTASELALLQGVTGNVQTQINTTREDVYGSPVNTTITLGDASYTSARLIWRFDASILTMGIGLRSKTIRQTDQFIAVQPLRRPHNSN